MLFLKPSLLVAAFAGYVLALGSSTGPVDTRQWRLSGNSAPSGYKCDLPRAVHPSGDGQRSAEELFSSREALEKQVRRHQAIVQVPTVCFDDMGPLDKDIRWEPFGRLHDALKRLYPVVHERADLEKINKLGLVYTIKGSDAGLQPMLLTAHQDVVPVDDPFLWKHPPFEGHFDGEWLWGRGAIDDKGPMTAIMSTLETLLANGWRPRRTVIVAFGFDEECSGSLGAGHISRHLEQRYGNKSMAFVFDEGGLGLLPIGNTLYAQTAVFEKGYLDVWFDLKFKGGHSSVPPPHTGIGLMSKLVVALEASPFQPKIIKDSPTHRHLQCQARFSPDAVPGLVEALDKEDLASAADIMANTSLNNRYLIQTSQAVDIIKGGVKINAVPESVTLGVNYRVAVHESLYTVQHRIAQIAGQALSKHGIRVEAFAHDSGYQRFVDGADTGSRPVRPPETEHNGTLVIRAGQSEEPSPVTRAEGPFWEALAGTIRHTYAFENGTVVPIADGMTANTDTRHYLGLSDKLFRWLPIRPEEFGGIHTVNERALMKSHMDMVRFYYNLVRVMSRDVEAPSKGSS